MNKFKNDQEWREKYYYKLLACRNQMMTDFALAKSYNDRTFKEYMEELFGIHGKDCVSLLLSNTIRSADWDGRYDNEVKAWAKNYPEIAQPPTNSDQKIVFHNLHLNEHPCILNQAARLSMVEQQVKISRERNIQDEKKDNAIHY